MDVLILGVPLNFHRSEGETPLGALSPRAPLRAGSFISSVLRLMRLMRGDPNSEGPQGVALGNNGSQRLPPLPPTIPTTHPHPAPLSLCSDVFSKQKNVPNLLHSNLCGQRARAGKSPLAGVGVFPGTRCKKNIRIESQAILDGVECWLCH